MYRLMISFPDIKHSDLQKYGILFNRPNEYILSSADEVCKVLVALSHLQPVITLSPVSCVSSDDILKEFELQEI